MSTEESIRKNADDQIQAHRQQHQKRLKKLFGGAGAIFIILLLIWLAYLFLIRPDSKVLSNEDIYTPADLNSEQIEVYREEFKNALAQYEIDIQPQIDDILHSNWESSKINELALLKDRGITAFANGAFLQAKQNIDKLISQSNETISQWETQTQTHINAAKKAFNDDEIPQSQLKLNKALALMPTNLEALALQSRIDAYGEVADLLNDLQVAKIENNLPKQIDLLTNIIELDPKRNELSQDLAEVRVDYNQQQLADLLAKADKALLANQLTKAQQLVNKAKIIMPNSKGAISLNNRIMQARALQGLSAIKTSIEQAAKQDQWQKVANLSNKALGKYPNDTQLKTFQSKADKVLLAKKNLAIYVAKPKRLADDNVRQAATNTVQKAFSASMLSPSLQRQIEQVGSAIDQYSKPVNITIVSDENTYIVVIGVGHVGAHKEKKITLTPGDYVLQGKREGYKNKRFEFQVKGNTPLTITLVCDEKI